MSTVSGVSGGLKVTLTCFVFMLPSSLPYLPLSDNSNPEVTLLDYSEG